MLPRSRAWFACVYYMVQHGMQMNIVPTQRVDWPPPYMDATEKYSSQVRLTMDHRSMVGYVAGQPFPLIDANDPFVANKVIWNNVFRPIQKRRLRVCAFLTVRANIFVLARAAIIDNIEVGHYAATTWSGAPRSSRCRSIPTSKRPAFWLFALYPVLAPQADRGTGLIRYRYADPKRGRR